MGVIIDQGQHSEVSLKSGEKKGKRNMHLMDETKTILELTVWGDYAQDFNTFGNNKVVIIKDC